MGTPKTEPVLSCVSPVDGSLYVERPLASDEALRQVRSRLLEALRDHRIALRDPLLDPARLRELAEEHDEVSKTKRRGRYGAGENWRYLDYLQEERP